MPRIHPYSRREFRRRLRAWVRSNVRMVGVVTVGLVVLLAFCITLLSFTISSAPVRWWLLGAVPAGLVATYLHLLYSSFLAHDAEAIWHVRGAWGEDNTRSELERAKRKKLVWNWVDSLSLQYGDIDHLVVTRRGGLVVIDSKWRNTIKDTEEMAKAAQKAKLRAEGITRDQLRGDARGSRRAKVNPLGVTPVVVLWGAAQHGVPEDAVVDGTRFVAGRRLLGWLAQLDGDPVDRDAAAEVVRTLEARRIPTNSP